ncbi:hypothetical protein EUGRSUZ_F03742 [Eucalyptus grandis]|uniref:Uncharacterized protein n=2 Tax=Eucalyptus grandis TaxID=71139 RepID=A0ACC3KMS2_EUCGR|nr:hypothetical protein EUGRSUZ_F03742 [Eucalyptus grandis]
MKSSAQGIAMLMVVAIMKIQWLVLTTHKQPNKLCPSLRLREDILEVFRGKPFVISLGTQNEDIGNLASSLNTSLVWIQTDVCPYISDVDIGYITIGNEVILGAGVAYVAQAIDNVVVAISAAGITKTIMKVSKVIAMDVLASLYPPSADAFSDTASQALNQIVPSLVRQGAPLMLNISLEYTLFISRDVVVRDESLEYHNLFNVMVDWVFAALEKINAADPSITISETRWPSAENLPHESTDNAKTYNRNFMERILNRTGMPRRPGVAMNASIFDLFNEDEKAGGVE